MRRGRAGQRDVISIDDGKDDDNDNNDNDNNNGKFGERKGWGTIDFIVISMEFAASARARARVVCASTIARAKRTPSHARFTLCPLAPLLSPYIFRNIYARREKEEREVVEQRADNGGTGERWR